MSAPPIDAATAPARARAPAPLRRNLLVMNGDQVHAHALPITGRVVIGRGADADIQLDHASISRTHVVLELRADGIAAIDQGGTNGTTLRAGRIPAGVPIEVVANEAIGVGDLTLVVQDVRALTSAGDAPARPSGEVATTGLTPIVLAPAMRRLYELAARLARGTISTLIVGETGTGKEMLAEYVHRASPRATGPLQRQAIARRRQRAARTARGRLFVRGALYVELARRGARLHRRRRPRQPLGASDLAGRGSTQGRWHPAVVEVGVGVLVIEPGLRHGDR